MKRLFMIRLGRKGKPMPNVFFTKKLNAKQFRDQYNEEHPEANAVVSYGPDHRRYEHVNT